MFFFSKKENYLLLSKTNFASIQKPKAIMLLTVSPFSLISEENSQTFKPLSSLRSQTHLKTNDTKFVKIFLSFF